MKVGFRSHDGVATIVADNVLALWGSNAFNSSVGLTNAAAVNSQKVLDIMAYEKLYPAVEQSATGAYVPFDIPAWAKQISISVYDLETDGLSSIVLQVSNATGVYTGTTCGGTASTGSINTAWSVSGEPLLTSNLSESSYAFSGTITLVRASTANVWCMRSSLSGVGTALAANCTSAGDITPASAASNFRLAMLTASDMFTNGTVSVVYR